MDELQQARQTIDRVDGEIARLFEERMEAVRQVCAYKQAHGLPVLDTGREQEVLRRGAQRIECPQLRGYYTRLLEKMMELSREYQTRQLQGFRVGYQGVAGAFSHLAASRIFSGAQQQAFATFEEIFLAVESGAIDAGVVPFENSYAGEVGEVLDLLWQHSCFITGRYELEIRQNLLGLPGARLADIRQVYSHPQALSQCQAWLSGHPFQQLPYPNTALAARYVSECADPTKAAIAGEDAAALYGLTVLAQDISTSKQNSTRFLVLSAAPRPSGNRFCLLFNVGHSAGALAKAMQLIANRGFNLECIRSRPIRRQPWQYFFYLEAVGDCAAPQTQELLHALEQTCSHVRLLGAWDQQQV